MVELTTASGYNHGIGLKTEEYIALVLELNGVEL